METQPLVLTFELASMVTILLFFISLPIAYWLAFTHSRWKTIVDTFIAMPLVLPPTVLGFYLLIAFSPSNRFGQWLDEALGLELVFSFEGLVLASLIYSLPFMVHPIRSGLASLPPSLREASYVLGKTEMQTIMKVLIPNIKPSILTAIVLTFAHTVGEFGVVLMIGGNIPGITKVASIAIYDEVEALNYAQAHMYSATLFALTFAILWLVFWQQRKSRKRPQHVK